jgi:hypothetical protein
MLLPHLRQLFAGEAEGGWLVRAAPLKQDARATREHALSVSLHEASGFLGASCSLFFVLWASGQRRTEAAAGAGPAAAESPSVGAGGAQCRAACRPLSTATAPSPASRAAGCGARCGSRVASKPCSAARMEERSRPAGGNIIHLLCLARGRRGACEPCAGPLVVVSSPLCKPRDPQGERITRVMRVAAPSDSGGRAERQRRAAHSLGAVSEPSRAVVGEPFVFRLSG